MEQGNRKIGMDRMCGLIVLLLGFAIVWQASLLKVGTFRVPGPGLYPLVLGLVTILLSLFLMLSPGKKGKETSLFEGGAAKRIAGVYAVLLFYLAVLGYAGFLIASFFLIFFLFAVIGKGSVKVAAFRALVVSGLAYLLFDVILKSQLPKGILGI